MSDNELPELPAGGSAVAEPGESKKRQTVSYKDIAYGLQTRVDTALMLLGSVKVERGSLDTMSAVMNLLRGTK